MKVYQINYDLRKQRNYEDLHARIRSYGCWAHPLGSCWIIASTDNAVEIRDNLASVMDKDDGLLVTRLQNEAAWTLLNHDSSDEVTHWLKGTLSKAA